MHPSEHIIKLSDDNQSTRTNSDDHDDAFGDYGQVSVKHQFHKSFLPMVNAFLLSF